MGNRLHVGTRKGLFELARGNGVWEITDVRFLGDPVSAVLADAEGSVWAALDLGHFGAKLWRRDRAGAWHEMAVPVFPPKPEEAGDDPHPWSLGKIWVLESGGASGRLSAGTMPGGLFRSEDAGATWREVTAIRPSKFGFAVAAHPTDPDTAWFIPAVKDERRIPVDGKVVVARTRDGGRSFDVLTRGLPQHHAYDLVWRHGLGVDESGERLAFGSTSGGLWMSEDGGDSWTMPEARLPPVAAVRFAPM